MSDYFRILRGLYIDNAVAILQGSGIPGISADTLAAPVGSLYLDNAGSGAYFKINTNPNPTAWISTSSATFTLISENVLAPTLPTALATNSLALGEGATTAVGAIDSMAIGNQSLARIQGGVVQASGRFGTSGDAQIGSYLLRTVTVNSVFTEAFVDGTGGSVRLALPDDSTWTFTATITGHRKDANDGHAGYTASGVIYRGSGAATTSLQGSISKVVVAESNTPWDINITADNVNGALSVFMKGQNAKIIRWLAHIETVEITN